MSQLTKEYHMQLVDRLMEMGWTVKSRNEDGLVEFSNPDYPELVLCYHIPDLSAIDNVVNDYRKRVLKRLREGLALANREDAQKND